MRARVLLTGVFVLLLLGGCGSSGNEPLAEKAGDLREAHDQIEAELLLNEVEEWTTEYAIARETNNRAGENKALREVHRAAYACWEFGIEECATIRDIESAVEGLEEEARRNIPFTHPLAARSHRSSPR
jgi:hypothetical protein